MTYVAAVYEIDRHYGGAEEGGWWYDSGELIRILRVFKREDSAYAFARRGNDLLRFLQRKQRSVGSVLYTGGRFAIKIHTNTAPNFYPESRPHYE